MHDLERYRAAVERVRALVMLHLELGKATPDGAIVSELTKIIGEMEQVLRASVEGARDSRLVHTLGLHADEIGFVWTVVAVGTDPRLRPHLSALGMDQHAGATIALHARIERLDGERAVGLGLALGPGHPLIRRRLLIPGDEVAPAGGAWKAPHRLALYLAGDDRLDAELLAAGARVTVPAELLADDATRVVHARLARAFATAPVIAVLDGQPGVGRRTAVAVAAAGRPVISLDVSRLAGGGPALERALGGLAREVVLTGAIPVVAGIEDLPGDESGHRPLLRTVAIALDAMPGACAVTTILPGIDLGTRKAQLRVTLEVPATAARRALWDRALGGDAAGVTSDERDLLAMRYRLGAGGVGAAVAAARLVASEHGGALGSHELVAGVRNNIAERMGGLATRVHVNQDWDELVLGKDTLDQIKALGARVRHAHQVLEQWGLRRKLARGTGVASLFSGPPGTGKTMVAGLIARDLDLELYQVDLSKVVSKWVGETEKQLSRIFDAADAGHALLLFDEADALFAKRTEVKSSVDRYANLEVNYLLQRVESFGGITILTTNMDTSIDPALMRRLASHVKFWPPEQDERVLLWRGMLTTAQVPLAADIDYDDLARRFPDMTGAHIRNAALAGAFLAAAEGEEVSQKHLARASRGEYASMGRQLSGATR